MKPPVLSMLGKEWNHGKGGSQLPHQGTSTPPCIPLRVTSTTLNSVTSSKPRDCKRQFLSNLQCVRNSLNLNWLCLWVSTAALQLVMLFWEVIESYRMRGSVGGHGSPGWPYFHFWHRPELSASWSTKVWANCDKLPSQRVAQKPCLPYQAHLSTDPRHLPCNMHQAALLILPPPDSSSIVPELVRLS